MGPVPSHHWVVSRRNVLAEDRKSTRLNSRHRCISYAVFCLKKKKKKQRSDEKQAGGEDDQALLETNLYGDCSGKHTHRSRIKDHRRVKKAHSAEDKGTSAV